MNNTTRLFVTYTLVAFLVIFSLSFVVPNTLAFRYSKTRIHSPTQIREHLCLNRSIAFPFIVIENDTLNWPKLVFKQSKLCSHLFGKPEFFEKLGYELPEGGKITFIEIDHYRSVNSKEIASDYKEFCELCETVRFEETVLPIEKLPKDGIFSEKANRYHLDKISSFSFFLRHFPPMSTIYDGWRMNYASISDNLSKATTGFPNFYRLINDPIGNHMQRSEIDKIYSDAFDIDAFAFQFQPVAFEPLGINILADKSKSKILAISCWENRYPSMASNRSRIKLARHCFNLAKKAKDREPKYTDFVAHKPLFFMMIEENETLDF